VEKIITLCGWNPFSWISNKLLPDKQKPHSPKPYLMPGWWMGLDGKPHAPEMKPWNPSSSGNGNHIAVPSNPDYSTNNPYNWRIWIGDGAQ
jgi:hypothetical protein